MRSKLGVLLACIFLCSTAFTASAQEATPAGGEAIDALFVQTGLASTLSPITDGVDGATHELVIQASSDQTIFFGNRPSREVGTIPTVDVVAVLSEDQDPPNAALVGQLADGTEEIVVIEILSAEFDPASAAISYQVIVLGDFVDLNMNLESDPVTSVTETREYVSTSLFIDDWCLFMAIPLAMYPAPPEGCGDLPTIPG